MSTPIVFFDNASMRERRSAIFRSAAEESASSFAFGSASNAAFNRRENPSANAPPTCSPSFGAFVRCFLLDSSSGSFSGSPRPRWMLTRRSCPICSPILAMIGPRAACSSFWIVLWKPVRSGLMGM